MMFDILNLIFPRGIYCISCGSIIDKTRPYGLCNSCMEHISWIGERRCGLCGRQLRPHYRGELCYDCMENEHFFDAAASAAVYGMYERGLIKDLKYGDKSYLAYHLGEMMYDRLRQEDWYIDIVTSVPVHRKREKERGYNQSRLLALEICGRSGLAYEDLLERDRDTRPLKDLSRAERFETLKGAFQKKRSLDGENVLLTDDIYTTGATVDECARALKEAGADKVYVITFASGADRRPKEE